MSLITELIKYGVLIIIFVVIGFKVFELTKKMMKKLDGGKSENIDFDDFMKQA